MLTVFDETQRLHAPSTFIVSGKPQPIPEKPERIDMLLQGVKQVSSKLVAPPPITMETVALVHDQRYLIFLETLLCEKDLYTFFLMQNYMASSSLFFL